MIKSAKTSQSKGGTHKYSMAFNKDGTIYNTSSRKESNCIRYYCVFSYFGSAFAPSVELDSVSMRLFECRPSKPDSLQSLKHNL